MKLLKRLDLAYSRALSGLRRAHIVPSIRGVGELMWEAGRAAGKREARKRFEAQLKDAERRVQEANTKALRYEFQRNEAINEANRRAAIIQSRLPANNGGYG